ncbi:exported hypothetical protein [Vibrio chagasii]|nr:exported hypothetical protein [Vibrio chagasii]CAH7314310.1 exported hypothetical protein [Vibrio chagasii]CAH7373310.1 exported hypothetical protein [Vibrio chagasii]
MKNISTLLWASLALVSTNVLSNESKANMWDGISLPGYGSVKSKPGMWDGIELPSHGAVAGDQLELPKNEDSLRDVGGFGEVLMASESGGATPKRTRVLTGYEYEEYVYKNAPSQLFQSFIFADGSTKISEHFRLAYVIKETHRYRGKDKVSEGNTLLTTEFMPRYEKWVNEHFNYAIELGYEKVSGFLESSRYRITPELNFSYGNHFLHLNLESGYWDEEKSMFFETEPLYVYRLNDWINVGGKFLYHEDKDDFAWTEIAIKPLVQFRFDNNVYLELRYEKGETEIFDGTGYDYNNYALYSEIPINSSMSLLADLAYRDHKQRNGNEYTWGDKEGVFAKVGIIWNF